MRKRVEREILSHRECFEKLAQRLIPEIERASSMVLECIRRGGKVMLCGNGGSAADAQHIAAELSGRFKRERSALPGIALTTDTSALTAIGNDYGYERVFSRQLEAIAREGDLLVAISTSGNSANVIRAIESARERGCAVLTQRQRGRSDEWNMRYEYRRALRRYRQNPGDAYNDRAYNLPDSR